MNNDYAASILSSIRRIIRSIDQHNKQLGRHHEFTVPQLVCLRQLLLNRELTPGQLAKEVFLSQATVTGILDRLEAKGLVCRERSVTDRRKVMVRLTELGSQVAKKMPWPLQERFSKSLTALPPAEIEQIDIALKRLVAMMETPPVPIWPIDPGNSVISDDIYPQEINGES